jgi:uncharacterized protein (TIGR02246 family)
MNPYKTLLSAAFVTSLCGLSAAQDDDYKKQIEAANAEFAAAYARGDAKAVAAMYTERAHVFPPNSELVKGRADIEKFWQGAMDGGIKGVAVKTSEVEAFGDALVEEGTYTLFGKDGAALDKGKYLVLWHRVEGAWKLHRDCWNSSEPAPK